MLGAECREPDNLPRHDRDQQRREIAARDAIPPHRDAFVGLKTVEVLVGHDAPVGALPGSHVQAAHRVGIAVHGMSNHHVLHAHRNA